MNTSPETPLTGDQEKMAANLFNPAGKSPQIALVTMVKDGANSLPALFESVRGFVDSAVVLDTGSTDGSQHWVKCQDFFPATLHENPFIDFSTSRNLLNQVAKDSADWLLLLDADMGLTFQTPFADVKAGLDKNVPAYLMQHDHGSMEYWIARLVRGDRDWVYRGVTHEYLERGFSNCPKLAGVSIWHKYNHGPAKFERDLRLLSADISRDPDDVRTIFYLANTLRDMGKTTAAIRFYCMRANMGGWAEEVFMAMYEAARLAEDPVAMEKAWRFRPERAEPLAWLVLYYRHVGRPERAAVLEEERKVIPASTDVLFVNRTAYGPEIQDPKIYTPAV